MSTTENGRTDHSDDAEMSVSHLKPGATYYLELHIGNSDGTLDIGMEAPQGSTSLDVAIQMASEIAESGMDSYVYECRAIRKVQRGKVRVTTIKPK